jgi:hypothetical protein
LQKISTLEFLLPLVRDMTEEDPSKRPTLAHARESMNTQFAGLGGWKKRWPIVPVNASLRHQFLFFVAGMTTEVVIFVQRLVRLVVLRKW